MSIIQHVENFAYKIANPIVKTLLRSPLHNIASGSLTLLHFTGRKSGRRFVVKICWVHEKVHRETNQTFIQGITLPKMK